MKGLIWFLICMRRPRPRSTIVGKLSSRSVWPVGAVSKTTTEKFIPFTSLGAQMDSDVEWVEWPWVSAATVRKKGSCGCTSWPLRSSWPHQCQGRHSWPPASSSCPCSACCLPQRTHRAAQQRPGWGRSPALTQKRTNQFTVVMAAFSDSTKQSMKSSVGYQEVTFLMTLMKWWHVTVFSGNLTPKLKFDLLDFTFIKQKNNTAESNNSVFTS